MKTGMNLLRHSLILTAVFSFPTQALEIANDTGTIINIQVRVHPTPSNNPCNMLTKVITIPNVLNNMTRVIYNHVAALCSYDIQFSSVNSPDCYVECPAPMGYGSDYRVVLASFEPIRCYAYPKTKVGFCN